MVLVLLMGVVVSDGCDGVDCVVVMLSEYMVGCEVMWCVSVVLMCVCVVDGVVVMLFEDVVFVEVL